MLGKTVSHYKIIEKLGEGGMGIVYKAEDLKLNRPVAIKFLPNHITADSEEQARFVVEAQAAASLNHPNIATIHSIEEGEDGKFIVMEWIDGKELKEIVETNGLPLEETTNVALQILDGLQAAHEKAITHRDIKSVNIMLTSKRQVKIMDFGLAKIHGVSNLTKAGLTTGTVSYMAPEQALGKPVDHRTDIWSFGVVLYEMLTKHLPFSGEYEHAVTYSVVNEEPEPVTNYLKECPEYLAGIIDRCLAKNPGDRYQSVTDIIDDLKTAHTPGIKTQPAKRKERRKSIRGVVPLSLSGIIVLLILFFLFVTPGLQKIDSWFAGKSAPGDQHLLVLPLTNIDGGESKQAFCDGLMYTLSSTLTRVEQFHGSLWVVPASEVINNNVSSPGEANRLYGVNLVVTGSLQFTRDLYRVTLNLVDAVNIRQINSSIIEMRTRDVVNLQNIAVLKLLEMLHLELNPQSEEVITAGGTSVPEAFEYFVRGYGNLQRFENLDNVEEAVRLFNLAVERDSNYALAHSGLAEAYWRKYKTTKNTEFVQRAIDECMKAFILNSKLAPVNVTLGMINAGTGNYEEAIINFNSAIEIDPKNAAAYRGLAKAYEKQEQLDKAELTYEKAINLKPDYWAGYNDLGVFYYKNGRFTEAIEQFKVVTELIPDNYRGYNNLGGIYYLLERWDDAREMFEISLELNESYSVASNLGTLYFIEGRYPEAAASYELALKLNDKDYQIWGNLASAYSWSPGEKEKANLHYEKAIQLAEEQIKINPNDASLVARIAGYYAMLDDTSQAIKLVNESLRLSPNNSHVMYLAGTTYEQLGNRNEALRWIAEALKSGYSRSEIEHQPELRNLISDPKFKDIIKELNPADNDKR